MFRLFFLIIVVRKTYKIITSGHLFCLHIIRDEFEQKKIQFIFCHVNVFGTLELHRVSGSQHTGALLEGTQRKYKKF